MRLTNDKRDSIIGTEVNKKFYDKMANSEKAIREELEKLAKKLVPKWITPEIVASGFISTSNEVDIKGENYRFWRGLDLDHSTLYNYHPVKDYSHKIEKSKMFIKLIKIRKELIKTKGEFRKDLRQVLYSYTTDVKLLEAIPELKDYFKDQITSTALVPLEQISRVRKAIKN